MIATVAEALLCGPPHGADMATDSLPVHAVDMLLEATQSLAQFEHIQEQVSSGGAATGAPLGPNSPTKIREENIVGCFSYICNDSVCFLV